MLLFIYKIRTLLASSSKEINVNFGGVSPLLINFFYCKKKKREEEKWSIDVITESQVFSILSFSQGQL
jgi:hypothetical protein